MNRSLILETPMKPQVQAPDGFVSTLTKEFVTVIGTFQEGLVNSFLLKVLVNAHEEYKGSTYLETRMW